MRTLLSFALLHIQSLKLPRLSGDHAMCPTFVFLFDLIGSRPPLPDIQTGSVVLHTNRDEKIHVFPLDPKQLTLAVQAEQEALAQ